MELGESPAEASNGGFLPPPTCEGGDHGWEAPCGTCCTAMTGEVCLRSGQWNYHCITVSSLPEGRPETSHVFFRLHGDSSSLMRVRVPGALCAGSDFGALAIRPDLREASLEGERWTFHPGATEGDFHWVLFMSNTGGLGIGELPPGLTLGEATNRELREVVKAGRMR